MPRAALLLDPGPWDSLPSARIVGRKRGHHMCAETCVSLAYANEPHLTRPLDGQQFDCPHKRLYGGRQTERFPRLPCLRLHRRQFGQLQVAGAPRPLSGAEACQHLAGARCDWEKSVALEGLLLFDEFPPAQVFETVLDQFDPQGLDAAPRFLVRLERIRHRPLHRTLLSPDFAHAGSRFSSLAFSPGALLLSRST